MKKRKNTLKFSAHLELTPLIDVVFLLIIFFMLSSSFILQPGITVELPKSSVSEPQEEKNAELTITKNDNYFFNAEKVSIDNLKLKLKELGQNEDAFLVIKADGAVLHEKVVEVMGMAKNNNINKLAVATKAAS